MTPDALTTCNACEWRPADPDSAAGYCKACERIARQQTEPSRPRWRPIAKDYTGTIYQGA